MRSLKKIFFVSLFLVFIACFNQVDEVTISKSGKIELVTTIEITDKEADRDKVKEEINARVKSLKKEGWTVSYKWKSKSKPYKIKFTASNNLNKLYEYQKETEGVNPSGVYIYKKFSEKQYVISFDLLESANNRILNLSKKSIPLYHMDENDKLKELRRIESEKYYYVFLK
jgi:hypothetical protein